MIYDRYRISVLGKPANLSVDHNNGFYSQNAW